MKEEKNLDALIDEISISLVNAEIKCGPTLLHATCKTNDDAVYFLEKGFNISPEKVHELIAKYLSINLEDLARELSKLMAEGIKNEIPDVEVKVYDMKARKAKEMN